MNWGIKLLQSSALPLGYGAVLYIMKGKIKLCLTNDIIAWHYQNVKHYFKLKFQNYTVKSARLSRILPILVPLVGVEPTRSCPRRILSYSSHSEPNGLNRNKTVFSVTFQNIKNPKKPYKISIFDAKHQKYKQFVPSSIIGNQIPNLRRWRDVGGM